MSWLQNNVLQVQAPSNMVATIIMTWNELVLANKPIAVAGGHYN